MNYCVLDLYQDSNFSPGVKIGPAFGVIDFHYVHIVKKENKTSVTE
jgi:hypothetical protein